MFIIDFFEQFKGEKVKFFVDMDGVVADYDVGTPKDYDKKRPLYTSIKKLEKISKMENVELHILSIARYNSGLEEKNKWLDEFAPFFKKENRNIITRESNDMKESKVLKTEFVNNIERDGSKIVIIDDDPAILHTIRKENEDVILLKDTALVD